MAQSRELEILTAKIQAQLAPNAEVLHDVKLPGRLTKVDRQIDVLVRERIGQYEMNIVLDCKDYKRPVDVKGIEEFLGLLKDVGANKGAMVCPRGFTKAAKTLAGHRQLDLYSPVDTDPHKWQARVTFPVVCDFRSAKISFGVGMSAPKPFRMLSDFFGQQAYDGSGNPVGEIYQTAINKWNEGRFPTEPGVHEGLDIFDTAKVMVDNSYGDLVPVKLYVGLLVERALYFHNMPIERISGFRDELSGAIITNAFTTGIFNADEVEKSWTPIESLEDAPVQPMMSLRGLVCWQV